MSALRQAPLFGRRALLAVVALAIIVGLIVLFSGSLTRSTDIGARADEARAEVAARELELAAGTAELEFFKTKDFIRWQARVHGFGEKSEGETLFTLPDDAPLPEPVTPIGPQDPGAQASAPFDAWMELLFGA
jgi:hypothetical protein